jgi:hypothetical protein
VLSILWLIDRVRDLCFIACTFHVNLTTSLLISETGRTCEGTWIILGGAFGIIAFSTESVNPII